MAHEDNFSEIPFANSGGNVQNLCLKCNSSPVQEDVDASGMTELGDKVHINKCLMLNNAKEFLLKLQNTIWNTEWEQQFVNIWDITKDKEVCDFLYRSNCIHLIAEMVDAHNYDCRLMEILMGILNNIVFGLQEDMMVNYDDMENFFYLFYCSDNVSVLTQILKFFGQVWCNSNIEIDYVDDDFCKRILFILVNVLNGEVLYEMLSCLILMCDESEFSEYIICEDPFFLKHCVKAYKQVYLDIDEQRDDETFTLRQYNCFYNLMWIVNNVSRSTPSNQLKAAFTLASDSLLRETSIVYKFLSQDQETIKSLLKSEALFVGLLAVLSEVHPVSYQDDLFKSLLKIVINSSESELPQNSLLDLVLYFICSTENYEQLKADCLEVGKRRTLYVLDKFANIKNEWNFRNKVLCQSMCNID